MSKRITFTDFEINQLIKALVYLQGQTTSDYAVIKTGRAFYQTLIEKLETKTAPSPDKASNE